MQLKDSSGGSQKKSGFDFHFDSHWIERNYGVAIAAAVILLIAGIVPIVVVNTKKKGKKFDLPSHDDPAAEMTA